MELWKNISNKYQISNQGNIRSVSSYDSLGRMRKGKILKSTLDKRGYPRIRLYIEGKKISFRIHRLVAIYFIDNPCNFPQVDHIDGNKLNNNVSNLNWVSNKENNKRAHKLHLFKYKESSEHHNFKGQIKVYDSDNNLIEVLNGNKDMRNKGFDFRLVSACLQGKRKTHRGMRFER